MLNGRTAFAFVAAIALALAGCGSANKTTSTATLTTSKSGSPPLPPVRPIVARTYNATLAPFKHGAPTGSALAAISVRPPNVLCWHFTQLVEVPHPTKAFLYRYIPGAAWYGGFQLGHHYTASGCRVVPSELGLMTLLQDYPYEWVVSIHTAAHRGGAVQGKIPG